jgi:GntR family histidine utilization transcriptional repressor
VPWNAAEHTIRAIAADEHVAKMLAVPRHSPCLAVNRRTWSADQPVTDVTLTYAGETHSLVARFAPQKG